jgi:hypothetical protein
MPQFLQQVPWVPILHCFMLTARSNTVSISISCARRSITWVASSMDASTGSANFIFLAADGVLGASFSLLIFLIAFSIVCIRILL